MANNNDKQEGAKQKIQTKNTGNDPDALPKQKENADTDTAPDEFIGADADTDTPIDGSVINDAVLRGENHPGEEAFNENDPGTAKKMDADKK